VPIYSADDAVHRLYAGRAAPLIEKAFPGTVTNGVVDRQKLSAQVLGNAQALKQLEAIVHPLVRQEEAAFMDKAIKEKADIVLLDIPLLFETGAEHRVDKIVVVSAREEIQRQRVLARPEMTIEKLESILARQMPDAQKREKADYIIDTSGSFEATRQQIENILKNLRGKN